uniref:Reverse transcriptase domain-containing protein n=1 Tax=Cannabis sativa TaxID=3483 RepID=A0A803Q2C4_CANSA
MDEVIGIQELEIPETSDVMEQYSEAMEQCIEGLKSPVSEVQDLSEWLTISNRVAQDVSLGKKISPPILRYSVTKNLEASFAQAEKDTVDAGSARKKSVKIDFEDIAEEVRYWGPSLVCYVIGANPPINILDEFVRRIWKDAVVKVGLLAKSIFIIRFQNMEMRDKIMEHGYVFFDMKPMVMKPWNSVDDFTKEEVTNVPTWIQLKGLDIKYWGETSLFKTIGQLGEPLQVDNITKNRDRLQYPRVLIQVSTSWNEEVQGSHMYRIVTKLRRLKLVLKKINKEGFFEIHKVDMVAKADLITAQEELRKNPQCSTLMEIEKEASKKRIHNQIFSIEDEHGTWHDSPEGVQETFLGYYEALLGTSMQNKLKVLKSVVNFGPRITKAHKAILLVEYTEEEVKEALFSIPGIKAPGPDGFGSAFYQDNWALVRSDFVAAILSFLSTGKMLKQINTTTITLIPKVTCPKSVADFRPISCCNVLYKIATKVICNRLRRVLPDLIADNQGGCVNGRYIAHNVLVCQDLVRLYARKNFKPSCMMKIDLRKAYDTVEWGFLEEMLMEFGFPDHFIKLIMICIMTVVKIYLLWYLGIPICSKKISTPECQIILEKMVDYAITREIEEIFRFFLWKGTQAGAGAGLVAWEQVCLPKGAGGLGLRNIQKWNIAAMTRYNFSVSKNYQLLYSSPEKKPWCHYVWDRLIIPKHKFILWLVLWGRLNTKERKVPDGSEEEPKLRDTSSRLAEATANFQQDEKRFSN